MKVQASASEVRYSRSVFLGTEADQLFNSLTLAIAEAVLSSKIGQECMEFWSQIGMSRSGVNRQMLAETLWEANEIVTRGSTLSTGFLDITKDASGNLLVDVVTSRHPLKKISSFKIPVVPEKRLDLETRRELR